MRIMVKTASKDLVVFEADNYLDDMLNDFIIEMMTLPDGGTMKIPEEVDISMVIPGFFEGAPTPEGGDENGLV